MDEADTRERLLFAIRANPGSTAIGLSRAVDVARQTAEYHLRVLQKAGKISTCRHGNRLLHFVNGSGVPASERELLAILDHPTTFAAFRLIMDAPWTTRNELTSHLGLTRSGGAWHLKKLMSLGIVDEHRERSSSFLFVDRQKVRILRDLASGHRSWLLQTLWEDPQDTLITFPDPEEYNK